jgi:23S rRNA pseudouridine2605 synthase
VLEMTLAEGKNREVRRMLAGLGHKVMSLTRTAVGPVTLKGLGPGEYRALSAAEVGLLRKTAAGLTVAPRSRERPRPPRASAAPGPQRRAPRRAPLAPGVPGGRERPPRPTGPPPSPRSAARRPPSRPESDEPRRRIIGIESAPPTQHSEPPRARTRRRLPQRRPYPRAGLGPRRQPSSDTTDE